MKLKKTVHCKLASLEDGDKKNKIIALANGMHTRIRTVGHFYASCVSPDRSLYYLETMFNADQEPAPAKPGETAYRTYSL